MCIRDRESLAALKEYNPTVFEYTTDDADYDLDAVDDPYEN